jgi:hypothetical protein
MRAGTKVLAVALVFTLAGVVGCGASQGSRSNQPYSANPGDGTSEGEEASGDSSGEASSSSDSSSEQAAPSGPGCTPNGQIEPNGGPTCCTGHRACDRYNECTCCEADGNTCL